MNRRSFLRSALNTAAAGSVAPFLPSLDALGLSERRLVILHTNDTHSRIDPFPMDGGRNQGLGGAARRATLINMVRDAHKNVLLVDSGDIFQGTAYFNFFKGEVEFKTMSAMQYDVATLGNHDFDIGVDGWIEAQKFADFEWVSANYDFSQSAMRRFVKPYVIRKIDGIRVGIFGLGIDFERLVLPSLHEGVTYEDPIVVGRRTATTLREKNCDLVICLSHLGHWIREDRPSDQSVAHEVPEIDIVLGGHSHTFLDEPVVVRHSNGRTTVVNQVGFAGIRLGRIDLVFDRDRRVNRWYSSAYGIDDRLDVVRGQHA